MTTGLECVLRCLEKPHDEITITLPDGAVKTGKAWETTPMMIAEGISKGLAQHVLVARVVLIRPSHVAGGVRGFVHQQLLREDGGEQR